MLFRPLLFILMLIPGMAYCVDGVFEINQTCAQIGCFPGDSPGFPIEITENGSYVLTSDIDVSGSPSPANRNGIAVLAHRVSINLNGFGIVGPTVCSGFPTTTSCSPTGTGSGIITPVDQLAQIQIYNGFIQGMGFDGLACGFNCNVYDLRAVSNGNHGISSGNSDINFRNVQATRNGNIGIFANGRVEGSTAIGNGGDGIFANPGSVLINNISQQNGGRGVRCTSCLLSQNVIRLNNGIGVQFAFEAVFGGNLIAGNGGGTVNIVPIQTAPNRCDAALC